MTIQMIIRIDEKLKEKITRFARAEGKSTSQVVREIMESYIRERDVGAYIEDLWIRVGKKLKARGVRSKDIGPLIKEARARRR
ncbi:MAG TPA: ribbon-helix-helix protein, CopG family [Acidobacteriota bacterium]|jgi:predicted DNA-binding protein